MEAPGTRSRGPRRAASRRLQIWLRDPVPKLGMVFP